MHITSPFQSNSMNTTQATGIWLGVVIVSAVSLTVWTINKSYLSPTNMNHMVCEPCASGDLVETETETETEPVNNNMTTTDAETHETHEASASASPERIPEAVSECAMKSVKSILYRAIKSIGERLTLKANLMDIVSRSTDATTVVLSRDTWFEELGSCIQSDHNIVGVSVKCPLTLRVKDGDDYHSVLLNAFAEYDIRLGTTATHCTSTNIIRNRQEDSVQSSLESILMEQYCDSVNNNVNCNLVCELCETEPLVELIGLPLTNVVVSQVVSRLLMPNHWSFDTESELCQFVYAQCITEKEKLSTTMTVDRVLQMFSSEEADTNAFSDENERGDETTSVSTPTFFDQSLNAIMCHWVDSVDLVTDTIYNRIQQLKHVQSGMCVWNKNSCALLVPQTEALNVNTQLHLIGQHMNTPIHTFIVQVQNRATVTTKPRLAHVTMIEVV